MTHLLPGGGVPRVHGARSPVPPRLPRFATPRSVHHLAAVAAGAYPQCRPPDAWSPGVPAPPGPCYWLVASGTPLGWRGGCRAAGLVRGVVRHYCLGGCSALFVCAGRSRPVRGGWGRCRDLCLPRFPFPATRFPRCVWRAVPSGCPLSVLAGTPFHAVCAFRGLGPVAPLVCPACPLRVRALALSRRPRPSPLPGSVWRAHLTPSRCLALVGPFHAVRAPPRVLPQSRALFGLLGGEVARSRSPLAWLGVVCLPLGGPARPVHSGARGGGGGVAACVPSSPEVRPRGPEGRGVTLPWSVLLLSLRGQQSACHWRRSGHGGRGPHTAPIHVRVVSPGAVCVAPLCAGVGLLACCGPRGSRRVGAWGCVPYGLSSAPPRAPRPFRGEEGLPPCHGGGRGPAPPWPVSGIPRAGGGGRGERGGGVAPWFPASLLRGAGLWLPARILLVCWRIPPRYACSARAVGQPRAPDAARPAARGSVWQGGGGAGRCAAPPRGLSRGAQRGGGREGRLAAVCFSALPGRPPRRVASPVPRPPHCFGSRPSAAVPLRLTGCPCSPAQGCRPAAGTAGVGQRLTGGTQRTAALAAAAAPLPWVSRPSRGGGGGGGGGGARARGGGCGAAVPLAGLRLSVGGGGDGGWGRGGLPVVPLRSRGAALWRLWGGGLAVPAPGGQPLKGGAHSSPAPLHPSGASPRFFPSVEARWVLPQDGCSPSLERPPFQQNSSATPPPPSSTTKNHRGRESGPILMRPGP